MNQNQEALSRAVSNSSTSNYGVIFSEFGAMGIDDIRPRENVFTAQAWCALGRAVKQSELNRGARVLSWIPMTKLNQDTGETESIGRKPRSSMVFHVSQTEARAGYSDGLWQYALAHGVLGDTPTATATAETSPAATTPHVSRATPTHDAAAYYSDEFTPINK